MTKAGIGRFLEDFTLDQEIRHATPRTVSDGDAALYLALHGSRFAIPSSAEFARALGFRDRPLDELLVFHLVFGKTVPDISLNAVANLGYAECRFLQPVYAGDTLTAVSRVIGLKQNSNGQTGVVYVRSTGANQRGEGVVDYVRWVMVRKRDPGSPGPEPVVPSLRPHLAAADLTVPDGVHAGSYDLALAGAGHLWDDYAPGERIDHIDGVTIEEAEHQMATRLYQNTARVHFNQFHEAKGRFGRRLIYGGHIISLARALSFNGLGNACLIAALNGGAHTAPTFAGDTLFAWSEVLERAALPGRADLGALRLRTVAVKDLPCAGFPDRGPDGKRHPNVVLDLDYWVLMPRRAAV